MFKDFYYSAFRTIQGTISKSGFVLGHRLWNVGRDYSFNIFRHVDYVRVASLELVANEIKRRNLEGDLAELGVYKGEFATLINEAFPDKSLYLFDTFEGFDKKEEESDKKKGFYEEHHQDFKDTSTEIVLQKMKHPEKCIIKKGYFPGTAQDMHDNKFVFVSIDTDLYDSILNGLNFFYPRLVKGGVIFVHDYNNAGYKGVYKAVNTYITENNLSLFPLCDGGGTAVLIKTINSIR